VDAGIAEGQTIHAHYDSLLAKVIAHGATRDEARTRLIAALRHTALLGLVTNQGFLLDLLEDETFRTGRTFTRTIESRRWPGPEAPPDEAVLAASIALSAPQRSAGAGERDDADRWSPWRLLGSWGRA
jgi:acetyl/propionyl-CoA carboxylase alpha subunit